MGSTISLNCKRPGPHHPEVGLHPPEVHHLLLAGLFHLFSAYLAEECGKPRDPLEMFAPNSTTTWPRSLARMLLYVPWLLCHMKPILRSFVTESFQWKAPAPPELPPVAETETRNFKRGRNWNDFSTLLYWRSVLIFLRKSEKILWSI